jgi:hypothetical protein
MQVWRYNFNELISDHKTQLLYEINSFSHHLDWCGNYEPKLIVGDENRLIEIKTNGNHSRL